MSCVCHYIYTVHVNSKRITHQYNNEAKAFFFPYTAAHKMCPQKGGIKLKLLFLMPVYHFLCWKMSLDSVVGRKLFVFQTILEVILKRLIGLRSIFFFHFNFSSTVVSSSFFVLHFVVPGDAYNKFIITLEPSHVL